MLDIKICVGTSCAFRGGLDILDYLEQNEELNGKVNIKTSKCIDKACKPDNSPVVMINDELLLKTSLDKVLLKISENLK